MKRNMKLIGALLLAIEAEEKEFFNLSDLNMSSDWKFEEIAHNFQIMREAELVCGNRADVPFGKIRNKIFKLVAG